MRFGLGRRGVSMLLGSSVFYEYECWKLGTLWSGWSCWVSLYHDGMNANDVLCKGFRVTNYALIIFISRRFLASMHTNKRNYIPVSNPVGSSYPIHRSSEKIGSRVCKNAVRKIYNIQSQHGLRHTFYFQPPDSRPDMPFSLHLTWHSIWFHFVCWKG